MVLALALIHHLAIANNVPLKMIAECFRSLAPSSARCCQHPSMGISGVKYPVRMDIQHTPSNAIVETPNSLAPMVSGASADPLGEKSGELCGHAAFRLRLDYSPRQRGCWTGPNTTVALVVRYLLTYVGSGSVWP